MDKMRMESVDMTAQNIEKIGALFPNCVTETVGADGKPKKAINFDLLRQMLSRDVLEGDEAYEFTWVGKKAAIVEANKPIRKTLRPCKEESVNWDTTENLYIEGDNLDVLKLLQESYLGKVKMIYIDPPYNTGSDFIYRDNFTIDIDEYAEQSGLFDDDGDRLFRNTDTNGRFHSDWCSMIYTRLTLARNLLRDDGVIFISIDNNEFANIKKLCDTVFGESSFVTVLHIQMSTVQGQKVRAAKAGNIVKNGEFVFVYSKNGNKTIGIRPLLDPVKYDNHYNKYLRQISEGVYEEGSLSDLVSENEKLVNELLVLNLISSKKKISANSFQEYYEYSPSFRKFINSHAQEIVRAHDSVDVSDDFKRTMEVGKVYLYNADSRSYFVSMNASGDVSQRISLGEKIKKADDFYSTFGPTTIRGNWWTGFYLDMGNVSKEGGVNYDNGKKPVRLIKQLVEFCTSEGDIILDFFSGSATTAHAVMELSKEDGKARHFIMVQMPEDLDNSLLKANGTEKTAIKHTIKFLDSVERPHLLTEIGKERIVRVRSKIEEDNPLLSSTVDTGFRVFKVDESNMNDVYYSPAEYSQDLLSMLESNVKADRSDLDLLFGCLLEWGLPLSLPYSSEQIEGCTVHNYNDGDLIACFDDNVPDSVIKEIAKRQPLRAVFRDSSFANSPSKINVAEIFKLMAPDTRVKVI
ncbi:site-specific DNA-methyltransferase [Facklamia hominis]|uniref:DNA methyltransferase n=1 Tax=Facklamia hominis TaxID=178214 RepID=A0AAJ1Q300_9LACT|nr:DNA methyltransferase [Facklamia hominis]MDK7186535.1 DNA methyltransferase [Facklamia hominis]